jgi:hypothetical protein
MEINLEMIAFLTIPIPIRFGKFLQATRILGKSGLLDRMLV